MKGKDLISVLTDKGFDVKSQSSLEALEFGVLMDTLTKQNQIENIDDYIDGITYIESKKKKPEAKEEQKATKGGKRRKIGVSSLLAKAFCS